MNKVQVNVGSLAGMGKRFTGAWNRAAAGEKVNETNVTFLDVQTMLETLSPRRIELLRHVRQHGAVNVRALAQALGRDYKNVHQDQDSKCASRKTGLCVQGEFQQKDHPHNHWEPRCLEHPPGSGKGPRTATPD